jgi:hypothetical protein
MNRGGVYVYRTRKPAALFRIPLLSYHFAYVGETTSFFHRHLQHMDHQPWTDLEPRVVLRVPLPRWKWLLRSVETVLILALAPVYNHKKNLWNPRRIPLDSARLMRLARDGNPSFRWAMRVVLFLRATLQVGTLAAVAFLVWRWTR